MNCFAFAEALLSFAASQRLEALLVRDGTRATAVGARAELKHARVGAGPEAEALLSFDVFELVILRCSFWSSCFQVEGVHVHVYVRCCAELTLSPSIYCRLPLVLFHRALDHCPLTHRGFEHTLVGPQVDLDASVRVRVALLCMMSQPCVASCKCRVVSCCFRALPCARAHPDLIEVIS